MTHRHTALATLTALFTLAAPLAQAQSTEAEVRKVDLDQAKLTLRHGEIKNLDMPPMTMVFHVADPKMLDGLKPGSKLRFDAEKIDGRFTVVRLQRVD